MHHWYRWPTGRCPYLGALKAWLTKPQQPVRELERSEQRSRGCHSSQSFRDALMFEPISHATYSKVKFKQVFCSLLYSSQCRSCTANGSSDPFSPPPPWTVYVQIHGPDRGFPGVRFAVHARLTLSLICQLVQSWILTLRMQLKTNHRSCVGAIFASEQ